jgi:hypothetical protein
MNQLSATNTNVSLMRRPCGVDSAKYRGRFQASLCAGEGELAITDCKRRCCIEAVMCRIVALDVERNVDPLSALFHDEELAGESYGLCFSQFDGGFSSGGIIPGGICR